MNRENPPPRPRLAVVLAVHVAATVLLQGVALAVTFILPVLARKNFEAGDWKTLAITAAPSVLFICTIFWHAALDRLKLSRYLLVYWAVGLLPLGLIALSANYWHLLLFHLVAAVGGAAWSPANGELLKRLYPDSSRGRAFAVLNAAMLLAGAGASTAVGEWLDRDPESFRWYMPAAIVLQLCGILLLIWLSRQCAADSGRGAGVRARQAGLRGVLGPVLHMREVLRADRVFYRYEAAFMTYGVGWMICFALLPILVTSRLHMRYDEIAGSTQVVYLLTMLAAAYPAGWLIDRLGAARTSGLSFALLVAYPVGLMLATGPRHVGWASGVYGVAMAGVNQGWMLGPVALAPSPDKVPHYVAIHATLVGLRGTLAQLLAVAIYTTVANFTWPLAIAAAAFGWGAIQMWQLHRAGVGRHEVVRESGAAIADDGSARSIPREETQRDVHDRPVVERL